MSIREAEIIPAQTVLTAPELNLTLREKSLVDYYLQTKVKWKAAKLAGYKGTMQVLCQTAINALNKPEVNAYYLQQLKALQVSSDELLAEIGEVIRTPLDAKVQKKSGVRVADKLKAAEMAGKALGMWDRTEDSHLTDADVARLGESLLSTMLEAAARKRLEAAKASGDIRD